VWALVDSYATGAEELLTWCIANDMHVSSVQTITRGDGPHWNYESRRPKKLRIQNWDVLPMRDTHGWENSDAIPSARVAVPDYSLQHSLKPAKAPRVDAQSDTTDAVPTPDEKKRACMTYRQLALEVDFKRAVRETWANVATDTAFDSDADRAVFVADCFSFYENRAPTRDVNGEMTELVLPEHVLFIVSESVTNH
jgi:hypothetical protein